jgi:hypothetical protein
MNTEQQTTQNKQHRYTQVNTDITQDNTDIRDLQGVLHQYSSRVYHVIGPFRYFKSVILL